MVSNCFVVLKLALMLKKATTKYVEWFQLGFIRNYYFKEKALVQASNQWAWLLKIKTIFETFWFKQGHCVEMVHSILIFLHNVYLVHQLVYAYSNVVRDSNLSSF